MSAELMERVACAGCGRAVESDVLNGEQLLHMLGWSTAPDGRVLCVTCRQDAGRPGDLVDRVIARS
jgi:hypothetical protein